jgi:hypothetical protein
MTIVGVRPGGSTSFEELAMLAVELTVVTPEQIVADQIHATVQITAAVIVLLRIAGKGDREITDLLMGEYHDNYMNTLGPVAYDSAKDVLRRAFERADQQGVGA